MAPLRIGLVGAGIGGVATSICLKQHGGDKIEVTILEAAAELGEIGAGIQMTPNVARLLIRWGADKVIGDNLVEFDELILRNKEGKKVGFSRMDSRRWTGVPWWLVHRMHLHDGLLAVARKKGVKLHTNAKINKINHFPEGPVRVTSEAGGSWEFDLVIGSDGINSIVRKTFLPDVKPRPPTNNAAFRAIVPMERMAKDPVTRHLTEKSQMDLWMGSKPTEGKEHGYIITYPISAGKDFNMVLSHFKPYEVNQVEDVELSEVQEIYKEYDPAIRRAIDMIEHPLKRWPLLLTVCPTWSSKDRKLVLIGDAAHSMTNHMAQGAATSMEDGAFLGVVLGLVAHGRIKLEDAIDLYENERMPLADAKQQVSFLNGLIYHAEDDTEGQRMRDEAMRKELTGEYLVKSPNLYADPWTWRTVYDYDPETHASRAAYKLMHGKEMRDEQTHITPEQADLFLNWFMPYEKSTAKTAKSML